MAMEGLASISTHVTRRSVIGAGVVGSLVTSPATSAPLQRARLKVGLYSITYLGAWYRGDPLTHEQLVEQARKHGYEGIELDGKRPHGNPLDMPKNVARTSANELTARVYRSTRFLATTTSVVRFRSTGNRSSFICES